MTALVVALGLFVFGAQSEPKQNICTPGVYFSELARYGDDWNALTPTTRRWWMDGFLIGLSQGMVSVQVNTGKAVTFPGYPSHDGRSITDVMTSLYKDPANVFITMKAMVNIADAKLDGKDIEPMLRESRRNDCGGTLVK